MSKERSYHVLSEYKGHLDPNNTVRDVMIHPSSRGFGRFILPLDRGACNGNMPVRGVRNLLPYHSHVESEAVVNTINYMIDQVNGGRIVFRDFYTERQEREDPAKKNAGIFFFKGRPGAPFAIVCPGGGFLMSVLFMKVSLTRYN